MDTWIHLDTPTAIESAQDTPVCGHAYMRIHLCYAYHGGCSIRNTGACVSDTYLYMYIYLSHLSTVNRHHIID